MLKEKTASEAVSRGSSGSSSSLLAEMFRVGLYKRSQGKIARRITLGALAASAAIAGYRLYEYLTGYFFDSDLGEKSLWIALGSGTALFLVAAWICFRLVNYPRFADFLIAVEAEMNKVSWPSKGVLARSSLVVILCLLILAAAMAVMDIVWVAVFQSSGVLQF